MILLLLALTTAQAAPEGCDLPYSLPEWDQALDRAQQALLSGDLPTARTDLMGAHRQVLCLPEPADPALTARLAWQLALAFFFDQDEASVRRWGLLSRVAAELPWDSTFEPGHPFREMVEGAELPGQAGPEAGLNTPRRGEILLNGAPLEAPRAHIEVPGLLQVVDRKGTVLQAWWIDGSAFPEEILGPEDARKAKKKTRPKRTRKQARHQPAPEPEVAAEPSEEAAAPEPAAPVEPPRAEPPAPEPPAPAVADSAPLSATDYLDPFSDARRRAVSREVSERALQGESGVVGVVRTEVITLASDPSRGETVTQAHFAQWLADAPEWAPSAFMARHHGGEHYLSGWTGMSPPRPDEPVVHMGLEAALAYCGTWGSGLAGLRDAGAGRVAEWRMGPEGPVILDRSGKVLDVDSDELPEKVGFRCGA